MLTRQQCNQFHNLRDSFGAVPDLLYRCSRCHGCYVCEHEAIIVNEEWAWRCKDGIVREFIHDGGEM